jgi:hypothetical protein
VLASDAGTSPEERAREVAAVGTRAGVDTVILADVHVEFGEAAGCRTKLAARAEVRVQPLGRPEMASPSLSLSAEQWDVPLEDWAKTPEHAREALRLLLEQLGGDLIDSYRRHMYCPETRCGW